jgi:trehalose/maltose hydrolase-like predicted phosphorylase
VVAISPRLPAAWRRVELPLVAQGEAIRLCIQHDGVTITANPGTRLRFMVDGREAFPGGRANETDDSM